MAARRPLRYRAERFGAVVALETPPALVSVDRILARRLGIDAGSTWAGPQPELDGSPLSGPNEVHLAVTEKCPAGCRACYADATVAGREPQAVEIRTRLDEIATWGAFNVAFGGGEATLRPDLLELAAYARSIGLVPTVTTSGLGIEPDTARAFRVFAQVNVSIDGLGATYEQVRGYDGAEAAERALSILAHAGVPVGVNTVVTRRTLPDLEAVAARAAELGAVELQLLRFKPSGRGGGDYDQLRPDDEQILRFPALLRQLVAIPRIGIRIDCALAPYLGGSHLVNMEMLRSFGVLGCDAGRSFMTVDVAGTVHPCSFWPASAASRGDTVAEPSSDETRSWQKSPTLEAFRRYYQVTPAPCDACALHPACRGGCRIVAAHTTGSPWRPDPECPVVRRYAPGHRAHLSGQGTASKPATDAT